MPVRDPIFDPPFNIVRVSHVELGVRDLERSRAFYADAGSLREYPKRHRWKAAADQPMFQS